MGSEKITTARTTDEIVSQDTSLTERKPLRRTKSAPIIGLKTGASEKTAETPDTDEQLLEAAPVKTRSRSNAVSQKQFFQSLMDGHTDSDRMPLQESEYYEREIEHLRSCIQQIHELRALLKGFPSSQDINDAVVKKKREKGKKYVDGYMNKWAEFAEKNPNIAFWYEGIVADNTDDAVIQSLKQIYDNDIYDIMALHGICDLSNQGMILPFRANIYSRLEKYKQDRDMSRFIKQSGVFGIGGDFKNKTIYSFKVGNTIVYGYLDGDNKFCTFRDKDELIKDEFTDKKGKTDESKKKKLGKTYDEEVAKIQALGELESKLDSSGLMNTINLETITSYMNFNESEFEKQAALYRTLSSAGMTSQKPDIDSGYDGEGKSGIIPDRKKVSEMAKDNALDIAEEVPEKIITGLSKIPSKFMPFDWLKIGADNVKDAGLLLENFEYDRAWSEAGDKLNLIEKDGTVKEVLKADVFRGLCINGGIGLAKCPAEALNIIKNCKEVPQMLEDLAHAGQIGNGGFFSEETEKALEVSGFISNDIILKSTSAAVSAVENTSKVIAGAGAMSLSTLSGILSVTGNISGAVDIISGTINFAKGGYDALKGRHDLHKAQKADSELGQYGAEKTAQNSRFLHRVEVAARQRRAQGILDTITGAAEIAAGAISLIPSPATQITGTVLSLANMALKLIGKFAISKYFKSKHKNQAWADILGFSGIKQYKAFEDKVGKENFRRVLRRKTGVTTRQSYADALNITDAIDIFTMAKLHSGKTDDTASTDEKIVQTTLSGVGYSDPKKYKDLKLKDVLSKVGVGDDWKSTLKASITDKNEREKSEDIA